MRPAMVPRSAALAALTAATLAAAGPPHRPADAHSLAQPPAPVTRPYVRPDDRWFGETRAVAVEGDRAYYSVGRAVAVADISDPAGPRVIGRSAPQAMRPGVLEQTPITEIAVSGRWLWAITGRGKGDHDVGDVVALFDVQDPTRPQLRSYLPNPPERYFTALVARRTMAVVSFYDFGETITGGLLAIKVDPTGAPYVAGRWTPDPVGAMPFGLAWAGDALVVNGGAYFGRVQVIDDGDGGVRFEPAGFAVSKRRWNQLAADGCRVYASEYVHRTPGADDFTVYDICADPPRRLGGSTLPLNSSPGPRELAKGISAATWGGRNLVFMTDASGGMWTIDATDPTSITWSADSLIEPVTTTPACLGDTAVAGSRLVASGCGLAVLELKQGSALPTMVGRLRQPPLARTNNDYSRSGVISAEGDAVVVAFMNALSTIDWGADAAPAVLGQAMLKPNGHEWLDSVADIALAGDIVWIAGIGEPSGVVAFDIRDRRRPVPVAKLEDVGWVDAIAASRELLVTSGPIQLFDVTDPAAPRLVGSMDPSVPSGEMFLADGHLFVASGAGLDSYDVSDPSTPKAGPFDHTAPLEDAAVDSHWIVTLGRDALRVYDRAAVTSGTLAPVARIPLPVGNASPTERTHFYDVNLGHIGDRTVAIASNDLYLLAIDITDPALPAYGIPYEYPVPAESIAVAGDRIYLISGATADMWSLDLSVLLVGGVLRLPYLANLGG